MKNTSKKAQASKVKKASSTRASRITKTKKNTSVAKATEVEQNNTKNFLIQLGLATYFTIYFIAHHYLGCFGTRWIFYAGLAVMVLLAIKSNQNTKAKKKKGEKFAEGFCFSKVFLIYVIGCMIGTYYEEIAFTLLKDGHLLSRQGIIYGPFNPVYGAGFLAFTVLLCRNLDRKWYWTYLYACLIGGITETISSLISEYVFKANAWDYSDKFLNIMGRTTVPYMLFWGLGGLIFVKLIYPALSGLIELLPKKIGDAIMPTFVIFVLVSHVVSYTALFRYGNRADGQPARNQLDTVLDEYWDDNLMKQYYDNSEHKKIGE